MNESSTKNVSFREQVTASKVFENNIWGRFSKIYLFTEMFFV